MDELADSRRLADDPVALTTRLAGDGYVFLRGPLPAERVRAVGEVVAATDVFIPAAATGLPRDSVVNITALVTLDKTDLGAQAGHLPDSLMDDVDRGLRRLLSL